MGSYDPDTDILYINEWVLKNAGIGNTLDSYDLMTTIVHELRHKYQRDACANPDQFVVTEETIQSWQENIDNYKNKSEFEEDGMGAREAFKAYRDQTIEKDARRFAGE